MANENAKNIFGIDLNVDKEYLSNIVKQSVMSSVAQALTDGDNGCIAQGIVNAALSVHVRRDTVSVNFCFHCGKSAKEILKKIRKGDKW